MPWSNLFKYFKLTQIQSDISASYQEGLQGVKYEQVIPNPNHLRPDVSIETKFKKFSGLNSNP